MLPPAHAECCPEPASRVAGEGTKQQDHRMLERRRRRGCPTTQSPSWNPHVPLGCRPTPAALGADALSGCRLPSCPPTSLCPVAEGLQQRKPCLCCARLGLPSLPTLGDSVRLFGLHLCWVCSHWAWDAFPPSALFLCLTPRSSGCPWPPCPARRTSRLPRAQGVSRPPWAELARGPVGLSSCPEHLHPSWQPFAHPDRCPPLSERCPEVVGLHENARQVSIQSGPSGAHGDPGNEGHGAPPHLCLCASPTNIPILSFPSLGVPPRLGAELGPRLDLRKATWVP